MRIKRLIENVIMIALFVLTFFIVIAFYSAELVAPPPDTHAEKIFLLFTSCYLLLLLIRGTLILFFSFLERLSDNSQRVLNRFPLVTIIVPCYNEEAVIGNAIGTLLNHNYPNFEVLVVDDGSTDNTLGVINQFVYDKRVKVISKKNGGKAEALNSGILAAQGEYVLNMDADSVLDPNVLSNAIAILEGNKNLSAVAGNVRIGNANNFLTNFQYVEYTIGLNFEKAAQSLFSTVTVIPGPVGIFRKSALLEIGGYDSDTFAEDCDLTIRLLMGGHLIKYCPAVIAYTEAPDEFMPLLVQRYRWARGNYQAIMKNLKYVVNPFLNIRNTAIIYYLLFDMIILPLFNFMFAFMLIEFILLSQTVHLFYLFYSGLTFLEILIVLYCVSDEPQPFKLVGYSLISKISYSYSLNILKFFASLDELFKIPMKWGNLERKGMD